MNIAVLGSGSWGTAIVKILTDNKHTIRWWVREEEIIEHIHNFGHNPVYLSSVQLPKEHLVLMNNLKKRCNFPIGLPCFCCSFSFFA